MLTNKQDNKGDNNNLAGRDVVQHFYNFFLAQKNELSDEASNVLADSISLLSELWDNQIASLNTMVYSEFGELVVRFSSGKSVKTEKFLAEKIVSSLGDIGVPPGVALGVTKEAIQNLISKKNEIESLSTSHVRSEVVESLYELKNVDKKHASMWGDNYLKKYGNPHQRVVVVDENSHDQKYLDHRFIKREILPNVFDHISNEHSYRYIFEGAGLTRLIDDMAHEVFNAINNLSVYRIHKSTIETICRELALQPPHPWCCDSSSKDRVINYDYKKFSKHQQLFNSALEKKELKKAIYSMREALRHVCSGVLAKYEVFMGCGDMSTVTTLKYCLSLFRKDSQRQDLLFKKTKISQLLNDLKLIDDISVTDLTELVDDLHKGMGQLKEKNEDFIKRYALKVNNLLTVGARLIGADVRKDVLNRIISSQDISEKRFNICLEKVIEFFPLLKRKPADLNGHYWVFHDYTGPIFKTIKSKILFSALYEVTGEYLDQISTLVEKNSENCNLAICVYLTKNDDHAKGCYQNSPLFIPFNEFMDIIFSRNPVKNMENLLFEIA